MLKILVLILIFGLFPFASAYHYYPDYQGAWNEKPVVCVLFDNSAKEYQFDILSGVTKWKKEFQKRYGETFDFTMYTKETKGCNVLMWFDSNAPYHLSTPDVFGATQCYETKGIIKNCNVEIMLNNIPKNRVHNVVIHEMGHVWGFGHVQPIDTKAFPAVILENDIMLQGVNQFRIITDDYFEAFEEKYGLDGWQGINNYTVSKHIIKHQETPH